MQPDLSAFETRVLHAGTSPDPATGARVTPIYNTTSFSFTDTASASSLFNLETQGHLYSRISNPTVSALEERLASLEGAVATTCAASGQAALFLAISTLCNAGDHIVAARNLYGGTYNMLALTMPRFGINTTFVDTRNPDAFGQAIQANTKLVIAEATANPGIEVLDIEAVASHAHSHGVALLVDSTFCTPYLLRPIELGADLVMHSVTKFLGGHGVAVGGAICDSGRFDWAASGRYDTLCEPYAGYHGIRFAEEYGANAFSMRARAEGLRDFGACMSPTNAFQLLQGVETLAVRMPKHVENAEAVATFLEQNPAVEWVKHPSLSSHDDHELAKKILPKGAGAIMSFSIKGGREAGRKFIESLKVASHLANVGDAKTLVIHPASTTHAQLSDAELENSGIGPSMIRISVGLENLGDICADLSQALKKSQPRSQKTS